MALAQILAISGKAGLYRYVAKARSGLVVEALTTKQRLSIPMTANVGTLSEIAFYTERGETPLAEVFTSMLAHEEAIRTLNVRKDETGVRDLFATILPDYLRDRVKLSDMQKAFRWFLELVDAGIRDFAPAEEGEERTPEASAREE